ncbi:hypothetical protein [uncultured Polaribacter sp.]|uniref:hypothetical protein n=1 Tax=uncultured Polaribacter sp. TaxID=174711 RepID=UPI00261AD943|nr:hypothetical protein [uncultured Polaribacter sp.]
MSIIKEEDLLKLYKEVDKLKIDNRNLQKGFVNLKLKSNKIINDKKRNTNIFIVLLILFILSLIFLFCSYSNSKLAAKEAAQKELVLLDSIQKITTTLPFKNNADVVYSIQLGVFKNFDIDFDNNENTNFKEVITENGNAYLIGNFSTYTKATTFKEEIKKLGLKDVFLVPYNKNKERIDIKEALVLSKEEEFIID